MRSGKMRLIPFDSFVLDLPDAPAVLAARLAAYTGPRRWLPFLAWDLPFQGEVQESQFRVRRVIEFPYRNGFGPELRGRFVPTAKGTRIEVTMALPRRHARALMIMLGLTIALGLFVLVETLVKGDGTWPISLGILIFPVFGWVMVTASFWSEARRNRKEITSILSG